MKFIDLEILNQLKDITINVSKRRCKNTMGQMFCIESAFIKKNLLAWFNKKIKSQNLEINTCSKIICEQKKPIS